MDDDWGFPHPRKPPRFHLHTEVLQCHPPWRQQVLHRSHQWELVGFSDKESTNIWQKDVDLLYILPYDGILLYYYDDIPCDIRNE